MAIQSCPECGGKVSTLAAACPHCGCVNFAAASPDTGPNTSQTLCAIASFFVPGLGQLIQGRGITAMVMIVLAAMFWCIWLGWVWHIYATWDAASYVPERPTEHLRKTPQPVASPVKPHPWDELYGDDDDDEEPPRARVISEFN